MFLFVIFSSAIVSCNKSNTPEEEYLDLVQKHRYELNLYFNDKETSPLTEEDQKTFSQLSFFEIDPSYKVLAAVTPIKNGKIISIPTTTERNAIYIEQATLRFDLKGEACELIVYRSEDPLVESHLFLPFTDSSNGISTYDTGRYIDIESLEDTAQQISIDFNLAYNPYCAYNKRYSCPIPPKRNNLRLKVLAGEQNYK
jgi:hypothetical protein